MWKLEQQFDQETGNTFEPKLIANYKPQVVHGLLNEEEGEKNQKKIYELGFDERNKEYQKKKRDNIQKLKRDQSPDFIPKVNPQKSKGESDVQSASSRFAKLFADSMIYEEKRQ